jgi:predicted ATPase
MSKIRCNTILSVEYINTIAETQILRNKELNRIRKIEELSKRKKHLEFFKDFKSVNKSKLRSSIRNVEIELNNFEMIEDYLVY